LPTQRILNPWILLLITYVALVIMGSLYPFIWQPMRAPGLAFLWARWPEIVTRTDILTNLFAYFPLGLFMANSLFRHRHTVARWLVVCIVIGLFSASLEFAQLYVPSRFASNVDIVFNTLGAALGAACAPLFSRHSRFMADFVAYRRFWFQRGWLTHIGLILLGLWVLSQASLQAPGLLAGELHRSFIPFWEANSLQHFKPDVMLIFLLDICFIGLFGTLLMRPNRRSSAATLSLMLVAIVYKFFVAALLIKLSVLARLLSLEVVLGLSLGLLVAWIAARWHTGHALFQSAAATLCLLILIQLVHGVSFLTPSGHAADLALQPELLLNITGLAFLVSEAWPYLALGCLLALWDHKQ
jgi:VanZ family protein